MTTIDWALYTEQAVGRGAPALADVINRPLREVMTISGADPDASFVGFSLVGHVHDASAITGGIMAPARGGTGLSSPTIGGLLVAAGAAAMTLLAPGASGQLIRSTGSAWASSALVAADISDLTSAATGITKLGTVTVGVWNGTALTDAYLATISTAGKVANSATTATAANTPSTIVARDASGNFAANIITAAIVGSVTGNASTATALSSTRTFAITGDVAGTVSVDLSAGMSIAVTLGSAVVTNASVSLTAAIAYSKLALTGSIVNADIGAGAGIVDTKLANITTAGKVANSATTATATNAVSTIVLRDGSGNFAAGAIAATSFSGDGSALTSLAAGAIASGVLGAARLVGSYTGITAVGTLTAGAWNATVIGPTFGGTGLNAAAIGDLLYASATNVWARLAGNALVARKFLVQAGDNTNPAAPSWGLPTAAEVSAGMFAGAFTFAGAVTLQTTLTTTMGTLAAGSTPASTSTATWNNASTVFVHEHVGITNTVSDAGSLVLRHQVNGATVFSVGVAGHVEAAAEFRSVSNGTHTPEFLSVAGTYPVPDANTVVTRLYSQIGPSGYGVVGTFTANDLRVVVGDLTAVLVRSTQSVLVGKGLLSTSAAAGFLYVPTCAGTPTGAPTAESGFAAVVWDTSGHKLWGYDGGAWH